jgi:tripartite-type tricarboxylate transporter receptor subunit TctC
LLKEFAGAQLKLLAGFAANGDIRLALERGEADGWSALSTTIVQAAKLGTVRPLVRGRSPVKGFEHLPVDETLVSPGLGRALMAIRGTPPALGRPYGVRPGTPADRIEMLTVAFQKVLRDPAFLAEMEKAQVDVDPISAAEVQKDFADMLNQPPEAIEAMAKYFKVEAGG